MIAPVGESHGETRSEIAFQAGASFFDIYTMDTDGAFFTNLTRYKYSRDMAPARSPDGSQIAFQSNRAGRGPFIFDIFFMDANGENPINLTGDRSISDRDPAWSLDGTRIAFASYC
jgi:TolB protein